MWGVYISLLSYLSALDRACFTSFGLDYYLFYNLCMCKYVVMCVSVCVNVFVYVVCISTDIYTYRFIYACIYKSVCMHTSFVPLSYVSASL